MARTALESMDIVLSRSWSHSNQKRRQSTSLNLKKPKCVLIVLNDPRVKETSAKCDFAAKPFRSTVEASASVFRIAKVDLAHECHFAEQWHQFRSCETHCEMEKLISHQKSYSAGYFAIAKVVWHTSATSQHSDINFAAAKLTAKLLRKWQVAAKLAFCCETDHSRSPFIFFAKPRRPFLRSSSPFSSAGQRSISQNGTNARGKVFIPFEPQKESAKGAKSRFCSRTCSKAFAVETKPPPVKPAPPKPPARRYLTRSGGQPLKKKARVESSEPIDLTEQSPEKSPNPSPVQIPVPSPVPSPIPSPEATPIPSPVPSPAPQEKAQEPQAPIPEPQIAAEAPLEEVIRRPCSPAPNRRKLGLSNSGIPF
ncbi:hypothetical protein CK203_056301 [Vitis vinifera]|uniref:Uncharacterized protein n=1 Tax=Vitis vinifera TaxID=29760 RepID=A0A438FSE0_VITVI|nr:hypothetical protein CK203_056301 [Vitis vinifera]